MSARHRHAKRHLREWAACLPNLGDNLRTVGILSSGERYVLQDELDPRIVAVLVTLRRRPRSMHAIADAIGEKFDGKFDALMDGMVCDGLVESVVSSSDPSDDMAIKYEHFRLATGGIAWLDRRGIRVEHRP